MKTSTSISCHSQLDRLALGTALCAVLSLAAALICLGFALYWPARASATQPAQIKATVNMVADDTMD